MGPTIYLPPMNFITFNDFLNCVYVPPTEANQRPSPDEVLEGLLTIYSGEQPDLNPNENIARKTVQGLKVIGAGVVKVRAANDPSVFTVMEKAPTKAFSWLKVPTSAFTFRH